jgi:hypothetical protein
MADRERLLEAMDVLLDALIVGQAIAEVSPHASLQHVTTCLDRVFRSLIAEGHLAVARELRDQLLSLQPPD